MTEPLVAKGKRKGGRYIFRRYVTAKDGRRIYPKSGKVFRFWVPD